MRHLDGLDLCGLLRGGSPGACSRVGLCFLLGGQVRRDGVFGQLLNPRLLVLRVRRPGGLLRFRSVFLCFFRFFQRGLRVRRFGTVRVAVGVQVREVTIRDSTLQHVFQCDLPRPRVLVLRRFQRRFGGFVRFPRVRQGLLCIRLRLLRRIRVIVDFVDGPGRFLRRVGIRVSLVSLRLRRGQHRFRGIQRFMRLVRFCGRFGSGRDRRLVGRAISIEVREIRIGDGFVQHLVQRQGLGAGILVLCFGKSVLRPGVRRPGVRQRVGRFFRFGIRFFGCMVRRMDGTGFLLRRRERVPERHCRFFRRGSGVGCGFCRGLRLCLCRLLLSQRRGCIFGFGVCLGQSLVGGRLLRQRFRERRLGLLQCVLGGLKGVEVTVDGLGVCLCVGQCGSRCCECGPFLICRFPGIGKRLFGVIERLCRGLRLRIGLRLHIRRGLGVRLRLVGHCLRLVRFFGKPRKPRFGVLHQLVQGGLCLRENGLLLGGGLFRGLQRIGSGRFRGLRIRCVLHGLVALRFGRIGRLPGGLFRGLRIGERLDSILQRGLHRRGLLFRCRQGVGCGLLRCSGCLKRGGSGFRRGSRLRMGGFCSRLLRLGIRLVLSRFVAGFGLPVKVDEGQVLRQEVTDGGGRVGGLVVRRVFSRIP